MGSRLQLLLATATLAFAQLGCAEITDDPLSSSTSLGTTGTGFDERAYTVLKQSFSAVPFSFEPEGEYHNQRFELTFRVTQGGTLDLEMLVFSEAEFQAWEAGTTSVPLYSSGRVMGAQVTVPITDLGAYRVVLNNRFSTEVGRTVILTAWLRWEAPDVPTTEAP